MKLEAAFQNAETPLLWPEVPLLSPEIALLQAKSQKSEHL